MKAGISSRLLRPTLGVVDPLNTLTVPPEVTAAAGADILTHAIESYTTRPYDARPKHHPPDRPAYIGANPASDVWCEKAIEMVGRYLRRAVLNGMDVEARTHLALAANYAGIGFGNAGVHLPHAVAYPVAGLVRDYQPAGYPAGHPLVPHGMSVILTAPAAFRFTYPTAPERHLRAAELLGVPVRDLDESDAARGAAAGARRAHAGRGHPERPRGRRIHRGRRRRARRRDAPAAPPPREHAPERGRARPRRHRPELDAELVGGDGVGNWFSLTERHKGPPGS